MYDDMVPWERDAYIAMLVAQVEDDNEKRKLEEQAKKNRRKRGRR
jgi:hypothetical protein